MSPGSKQRYFSIQKAFNIPAHISCLVFGHAGHLFAGSDDGSLRVYDLSSFKVIKAIRGLGAEVSSIVCIKRSGSKLRDVWLASGRHIMNFRMDSATMIQVREDALSTIDIGDSNLEDQVLNEIALHSSNSHIAFSMDSGTVGVVDLTTKVVLRMKTKHENVCATVKFIPGRPREMVSGGYDTSLLHFDFYEGKILSSRKIPTYEVAGGVSLSPPFVLSTSVSSSGLLVAGTADGRVYLGYGGYKQPKTEKSGRKRSRKWDGLNEVMEIICKIADGPIVALAFDDANRLTVSTLMGVISQYEVNFDEDQRTVKSGVQRIGLNKVWEQKTQNVQKVNTLAVDERRVIVGGLTANGTGIFEIWIESIIDHQLSVSECT